MSVQIISSPRAKQIEKGDITMKLTKSQKQLLDYLGKDFSTKVIDWELCLYRKFIDYDVEISGGYYRRPFNIYVWRINPHYEIIERHFKVPHNYEVVKNLLDDISSRYQNLSSDSANAPGELCES